MNTISISATTIVTEQAAKDKATRIEAARTAEHAKIVSLLQAGGYINDDHTGSGRYKVEAVAIKGNFMVPLYTNHPYYSINQLYVGKDGEVHLSTFALGTVYRNYGDDFERTVREFNDTVTMGDKISHLIRI